MKRIVFFLLVCLLITGCSAAPQPTEATTEPAGGLQIGNPWKDYSSLEEAETACGLRFPLGDTVAGSYVAESFRVLNGELLEVTYRNGISEVTVRMQSGEGRDIAGVYMEFEEVSTFETETYTLTNKHIAGGGILQLAFSGGYSYSFYAPNGYAGDSNADFLAFLNP